MIDPELAAVLDLMPEIDLSDPVAARAGFAAMSPAFESTIPGLETLDIEDRLVPGWEGTPRCRCGSTGPRRRRGARRARASLMIHGGGFILGSVEAEHAGAALTAPRRGAVVVSVEYRLAPEHPYPAGLHDCYAALCVPSAEAGALGVDPARVALLGRERRRRAGGGDRPAGPGPRRPAGVLPDAAHPRARRSPRDAVDAGVRRLADLEPPPGRAELAGLPRAT